ncbi:toprim domain-containing protein [Alistipes sp.]|jgi:hypothetical protein|uniref:toprim domain-containing protein n=1 Tax=Alistipes sp. TaxID=1872444 RepID=UPI003AF0304E
MEEGEANVETLRQDFARIISPKSRSTTVSAPFPAINLPKAMLFLQRHRIVYTFFDNDDAGRQATAQVQQLAPAVEVVDQAPFYRSHNDLNYYLQARQSRIQQAPRQQPPRTISKAPNPGPKHRRIPETKTEKEERTWNIQITSPAESGRNAKRSADRCSPTRLSAK